LTGLTDLDLYNNEFLTSTNGLQGMTHMRKLDLQCTHVCSKNHGMDHACTLSSIAMMVSMKELILPEATEDIEIILVFSQLVKLALPGCVMTDSLLDQAARNLPLLEELVLSRSSSGITSISDSLRGLSHLRLLALPACPNLQNVSVLGELSALEHLELGNPPSYPGNPPSACHELLINGCLKNVLAALQLKTLKLYDIAYDDSVSSALVGMHDTLTELVLVGTLFPSLFHLTMFTKLETLFLGGAGNLSLMPLAELTALTTLRSLHLFDNYNTDPYYREDDARTEQKVALMTLLQKAIPKLNKAKPRNFSDYQFYLPGSPGVEENQTTAPSAQAEDDLGANTVRTRTFLEAAGNLLHGALPERVRTFLEAAGYMLLGVLPGRVRTFLEAARLLPR
jgi:hypothetical protein